MTILEKHGSSWTLEEWNTYTQSWELMAIASCWSSAEDYMNNTYPNIPLRAVRYEEVLYNGPGAKVSRSK